VLGVVSVPGFTDSHPPDAVVAVALMGEFPPLAVMVNCWLCEPFSWSVNPRLEGFAVSPAEDELVTLRVTPTVNGLLAACEEVIVIWLL
jgi:hypothetical protein